MGTYSNRSHLIPEASSTPAVSHFAWFYPGSFFSKTTSGSSQGTQTNTHQGLNVSPICSIPPIGDRAKNNDSGSKMTSSASQGTQSNPQQGLNITPICSIPPTADQAKKNDSGSKRPKVNKKKSSAHGPNQVTPASLRTKKPRKSSSGKTKAQSMPEVRREKKNLDINIDRTSFDFSGVPTPYCSCTGIARVCYKWGAGGWQSSCCTTNISEYPLPMSSSRPGARLAGRKMSNGAYGKLLVKLATEGYDLSHPVDLKSHWARHGTNKFVTIK